jgi:osmotically-inducible protein OsmY
MGFFKQLTARMNYQMKNFKLQRPEGRTQLALIAVIALTQLCGCAPLIVGGAAMAGKVAIDRRTAGIQVEDEAIEIRSESGLRSILPKNSHVKVSSYNRLVLLTGEINSENEKALAERFVKSQDNVKTVINELSIAPESSLTQRAKDQWITVSVKTQLLQTKDIHASAVHVVTQNGVVYLMGRVTSAEATRASHLVSTGQTSGVQKVVKVFEAISEEDLQRLVAPALR